MAGSDGSAWAGPKPLATAATDDVFWEACVVEVVAAVNAERASAAGRPHRREGGRGGHDVKVRRGGHRRATAAEVMARMVVAPPADGPVAVKGQEGGLQVKGRRETRSDAVAAGGGLHTRGLHLGPPVYFRRSALPRK